MSRQKANTSYHSVTGGNLDKIGDNGLNNPDGSFKDPMWKAMYDLAYGDYSNNDWNYADMASAVDGALPPLEAIAVNTVIGFVVIKDYKSNMHIAEEIDSISSDKKYAGILIVGY